MNWSYFQIFTQSMGFEALIIGLYFYFFKKDKALKVMAFVFMLNACTHPVVVFLIMKKGIYIKSIMLAEAFAWLSESFIYKRKIFDNWIEALCVSLVANLVSWQMGPLLTLWLLGR